MIVWNESALISNGLCYMKRLTLEEIGKIAGVSRATVSRVINNHPNISDEVRERVQEVIAETGYQPNLGKNVV